VAQGSEDLVDALPGPASARPAPLLAAVGVRLRAYHELAKPNLSALVVVTAVLGFYLATPPGAGLDASRLAWLAIGTALTSAGACASNMVLERDLDRAMLRTRVRPIPSGRLGAEQALAFAVTAFVAGFAVLLLGTGLVPAALALFTALVYALVYTPLKRRGPVSIWVGAVPGAVPPVMGWAAVTGEVGAGGLALFAILFAWQFPHFLALAFMYRDDYARAGFRFLPEGDVDGARTGRHIALGCGLLLAASLGPALLGLTGPVYLAGALAAGLLFGAAGLRVARASNPRNARRAFLASIVYLPALLALLVLDRLLA
jgi:protoheme IX farnesyltransferase